MRKKIIVILISVLAVIAIAIRITMCLECAPVIRFLEETKEIVFSGSDDQATSIIDSHIRRIRLTQRCNLPIVFSASIVRHRGDQSLFWVSVDWVQRNRNQRQFLKVNLRFDHESGKKELTFDIPSSSQIDEPENEDVFADNYFVCFVEDASSISKDAITPTFALPYHFSNSPVYISITDNNGESTDWIKCNVVYMGSVEKLR